MFEPSGSPASKPERDIIIALRSFSLPLECWTWVPVPIFDSSALQRQAKRMGRFLFFRLTNNMPSVGLFGTRP